jgi:SOS response regulatory protein OraA/RecX
LQPPIKLILKYLSYQSRSAEEIRNYLQSKEAIPEDTEIILRKLTELGYLDDERFCNEILDYCIRNRKGPKFLEMKLKEKGIDSTLIQDLRKRYDRDTETEVIREEAEKILERYKMYPIRKRKIALCQKLLRDGFHQDAIDSITCSLQFTEVPKEVLEKEYQRLLDKYAELSESEKHNQIIRILMSKGYEYSEITKLLEKQE